MEKFLVKMLLHKNRNTFQEKNGVKKIADKLASVLNLQKVSIVTLGPGTMGCNNFWSLRLYGKINISKFLEKTMWQKNKNASSEMIWPFCDRQARAMLAELSIAEQNWEKKAIFILSSHKWVVSHVALLCSLWLKAIRLWSFFIFRMRKCGVERKNTQNLTWFIMSFLLL